MSDKRPRGRPPFVPTEQQRHTVEVLVAHGVAERVIAKVLGIDRNTLRKHFRDELRVCIVRAALAGDWRAAGA
jgi:DNA invertase Pin-like site-specific DNA recombinase